MLNRKRLIAVFVLLAVMCAVPSWGAKFRKMDNRSFFERVRRVNNQSFFARMKRKSENERVIISPVSFKMLQGTVALFKYTISLMNTARDLLEQLQFFLETNINAGVKTELREAIDFANTKKYRTVKALAGPPIIARAHIIQNRLALINEAHGQLRELLYLLEEGIDVNVKTDLGETALMRAADFGKTENVNLLIESGAYDLSDNEGRTALIHASIGTLANPETVNTLIDAGSYVMHKDKSGRTALDYALDNPKLRGTDALKRLEELSR